MPWEKRFGKPARHDWSGAFHDAAEGLRGGAQVFVVVDPLLRSDRRHVDRLHAANGNLRRYNLPGVGHKMPVHMLALGVLKPFVMEVLEGRVPQPHEFARRCAPAAAILAITAGCSPAPIRG